jgi:streptogramin lyase
MRIDPSTNKPKGSVHAGTAPLGLALGFGSLWVAGLDSQEIDRVNPRTGKLVARLPVGGNPVRLAVGFGSVWLRDDAGRVVRIKPTR